jgi:2-succinyl-5-enolpyruvyl-6-hydroxy-3-cyclohexene-1-carboxylate synthase
LLLSNKVAVRDLVEICSIKGIKHVIIAPGSRNAPLTISFNRHPNFTCHSIVDERCAAFFAMGLAQQLNEPVAICCTSGTAVLNFASAIAEAFYQKIPLLILTADRPPEWVGQMDGQTIKQSGIFGNYIKKSFDLPVDTDHADDRWYAQRIVSEAIESTLYPESGPVHINLPFREPLYEVKDYSNKPLPKVFETTKTLLEMPISEIEKLQKNWNKYSKILIVTGLLQPNHLLNKALNQIGKQNNIAILTETTSNVFGENFNRSIDRLIVAIEDEDTSKYKPELLVTLGGPVVSKKVKAFLRKHKPIEHWHINASNDYIDTFQGLTKIIPLSPEKIIPYLINKQNYDSNYREIWLEKDHNLQGIFNTFLNDLEFCDLKAFELILNQIPNESVVQLANSTAVRYSNLFDQPANKELKCYSNRGTSGIDGTISTAVGSAKAKNELTTVISGDLSFFYDSNALWISPFPQNLKIIVINNKGGSIFRIIDGPAQLEELEPFFEVKHDLNAEYIAKTFGIDYYFCNEETKLKDHLNTVYNDKINSASLLEISTDNELNPEIIKRYFKHLKQN